MIQAVAIATNNSKLLIAGGSSSGTPRIYLWEKKVTPALLN